MLVLWVVERRDTGPLIRRVATIGLIALALAFVLDVRVSFFSNEREISAQQFVMNLLSVVDPSGTSAELSGTADWRMQYWRRLLADVRDQHPLTGFGFGINLREQYGEQDEETPARDTHNSHIGVYARAGLIGLLLWSLTWGTWFAHMRRVHRAARQAGDRDRANLAAVLVAAIVTILVNAFFDPALEGPQVAVWAWTLFGIGATLRPHAPGRPATGPSPGVRATLRNTDHAWGPIA
jgi:O-antigen ligase